MADKVDTSLRFSWKCSAGNCGQFFRVSFPSKSSRLLMVLVKTLQLRGDYAIRTAGMGWAAYILLKLVVEHSERPRYSILPSFFSSAIVVTVSSMCVLGSTLLVV